MKISKASSQSGEPILKFKDVEEYRKYLKSRPDTIVAIKIPSESFKLVAITKNAKIAGEGTYVFQSPAQYIPDTYTSLIGQAHIKYHFDPHLPKATEASNMSSAITTTSATFGTATYAYIWNSSGGSSSISSNGENVSLAWSGYLQTTRTVSIGPLPIQTVDNMGYSLSGVLLASTIPVIFP